MSSKAYSVDQVIGFIKDAANLSAAATIDPGRWCDQADQEDFGDWASRARTIAITQFLNMRLLADGVSANNVSDQGTLEDRCRSANQVL